MEQLVIKKLLEERLAPDSVCTDELMSRHTTFRIGGPASVFVTPKSEKDLVTAIEICRSQGAPYFILGNGSNLLVSDQGYDGVVVHIGSDLRDISVEGTEITAKTGTMLSQVAHAALAHGLTGMEFAAGIPGSLGGAVFMNAGAYGGEIKDIAFEVYAMDINGNEKVFSNSDCCFGYRSSVFSSGDYIITGAKFRLSPKNKDEIFAQMRDYAERRRDKQPLSLPSAGSTFKRPEGYFAGKLIQDSGLRGFCIGGASVSEKHCGFVVNTGGATCADVINLIEYIKKCVYEKFGVALQEEVRIIGRK